MVYLPTGFLQALVVKLNDLNEKEKYVTHLNKFKWQKQLCVYRYYAEKEEEEEEEEGRLSYDINA